MDKATNLIQQPELASQLLQDFVKLNKLNLSKIKSTKGKGSIADFMLSGTPDLKQSHQILDESLEMLFKSSDRPNILLAIDQANGLYSKSAYNDKDSNPITTNRFQVMQSFYKLLNANSFARTSIVLAMDNSKTQIRSHYLEKMIAQSPVIHDDPMQIKVDRFENLDNITEFGAILPEKLDPSSKDLFPADLKECKIPNLQIFKLPIFNEEETKAMLQFYRQTNCLHVPLTEDEIKFQWMAAQGNPWEIFRGAIAARSTLI